jgi:universal stress protein E
MGRHRKAATQRPQRALSAADCAFPLIGSAARGWYNATSQQEMQVDLNTTTASQQQGRPGYGKTRWQRILVVIDPTRPEQVALEKAARIALTHGGELQLYICDVQQEPPESWAGGHRSGEYREILRTRALAELQALASPLREDGLTVTIHYEWHAPLEQGIARHVLRTRPDLVVKETHLHASLPESQAGRTDWSLIRQLPAALLLVRPGTWPARPRIAAAVDPLHPADRPAGLDEAIVQTGHALADLLHGSLDVLHVLEGPAHLPGEPVTAEQKAQCHAGARHDVERLAGAVQAPAHYAEGNVALGLIGLARRQPVDVMVMGAVARVRSPHAIPGGQAARILEHVNCDLLVVKPAGFVSPLLVTAE